MQIFGEIPFIKLKTTLKQHINGQKRWKMKEEEEEEKDLFWFSFYRLFGVWKIVGMNNQQWTKNARGRSVSDLYLNLIL